ncbi:MAG: hypothetical protein ACRD2J_07465, partial [Thermoanaerobaculia bacterium]
RGDFFVTFLDIAARDSEDDSPEVLLRSIKERDAALPVVVIDGEADLRRRHDLLSAGADFYLTKPSPAHLQPGLAEETLGLFAEELMMFAERSFQARKGKRGSAAPPEVERELLETSGAQRTDRSFALLRRLISELTTPDDLSQVADTILRIAAEYLERAALFAVHEDEIEGLSGYGATGEGDDLGQRVGHITIARTAPTFLDEAIRSRRTHRGKVRHSPANEAFVKRLGSVQPSELVLLPVANRGKVVGIVYGDNGVTRSAIPDVTGLEIFLSQAGLAFESALVATSRGKDAANDR